MSQSAEPTGQGATPRRQAYEPPLLGRVSLEADQVLSIGCKTVTGGGTIRGTLNCELESCVQTGS